MGVFWTTIFAEAEVFFAVFVATAIILWVNGSVASRFARSPWTRRPADFEWKRTGVATSSELLEFMRLRLPWPVAVADIDHVTTVLDMQEAPKLFAAMTRLTLTAPYRFSPLRRGLCVGIA